MFLDRRLRALENEKKRLLARSALHRRLLGLEWGLFRAGAARQWTRLAEGVDLVSRLLGLARRR
ncbi:hypothetical protein [Solidesulfovibrio sp.]|uniref:hypothetical protein n=1 Tax=Solidesulfovibrio sp. TaxID=2910990 RepID=UPI00261C23F3|nr:hypothetical protein [Solidesulfovibrio sp.]